MVSIDPLVVFIIVLLVVGIWAIFRYRPKDGGVDGSTDNYSILPYDTGHFGGTGDSSISSSSSGSDYGSSSGSDFGGSGDFSGGGSGGDFGGSSSGSDFSGGGSGGDFGGGGDSGSSSGSSSD